MDINNIQKPRGLDNVTQKNSNGVEKSKPESKGILSGQDGVEISEEAQEIREMISGSKSELIELIKDKVPDVRAAKVQEVTEKLSSGFYDRPEVIEKLADKLIKIL